MPITDQDFKRLVSFMKANYGIDLSKKRQLILGRLSNRAMAMGFTSFTEYVDYILNSKDPRDVEDMLNRLTTNYTFFMREETHFTFFRDTILPYLERQHQRDHVLSIWSAGCSSGQEPYTISMILKDYFSGKSGNWDTRVLATDISQRVLGQAQQACYEEDSLQSIPGGWRQKYFQKAENGLWQVKPEIRSNVIFKTFNLMDPIRFRLKFDVIFCRNVMIYFDQPTKDALVQRFFDATVPGGYLLIGHSEGLNKANTPYEYIMPATYRKRA